MSTATLLLRLLATSLDADDKVRRTLKRIERRLDTMSETSDAIAAAVADQTTKIDALQSSIDTKQEAIAAAIATQTATIEDLRAQLAAGADPAALDAILASLAANNEAIDAANTDVTDTPV